MVFKKIKNYLITGIIFWGILWLFIFSNNVFAASKSEIQKNMIQTLYGGGGGWVSCDFDGYTTTSGRHEGIDFTYYNGATIHALISGEVIRAYNPSSGLSTLSIYDAVHNKSVIYLHATGFMVSTGDSVTKGQPIASEGTKGTSAAHTHIEVRNGRQGYASKSVGDPVLDNENPYPYWELLYDNTAPTTPPSNATISKSQVWYDLGDTIDIYMNSQNATGYYMSMFKDDQKIISESVDSGHFSMPASSYGTGHYSVYCTASNVLGSSDSPWIDFDVVGAPSYSSVSVTEKYYDISWNVSISVSTICAKGQVIGIDKEGVGRVITETCDSTYTIPASSLGVGKYSAYFSVYNGSGTKDTKRVEFEIVDMLSDADKADLGDEFYAYIENQASGLYLTNQNNEGYHIGAEEATGKENQVWKFTKLSNGAYKVQSLLDGGWLDVEEGYDEEGTNVIVYPEYKGQTNQQFYLYQECEAIYIKPLSSEEKVLDVSLGSDKNLEIWYVGVDWGAQEFNIKKISDYYNVFYDASGGRGAPEEQMKIKGVELKLSSDKPEKSIKISYKANGGTVTDTEKTIQLSFAGWNTSLDGSGTDYQPGDIYKEDEEATLYAQWEETKIGEMVEPKKDGYIFEGWYDADTGQKVTKDTVLSKDITVYARWVNDVLPGDVNGDGKVNAKDSALLRLYILNGAEIDEEAADVDGNGKINPKDSVLLRRYLLGYDVELN